MRVALIGPVPPRLGGLTPGGVATHQVHLAEGLAAAGVEAALLATNTSVAATDWGCRTDETRYPLYRMAPAYQAGYRQMMRYGLRVATNKRYGSRREVLRNVLQYRRFLAEVQPDLIHVQHPLERSTYARLVREFEGWQMPLVVTAHSLFGEHQDATIRELMAPNLRAAERVIAVSEHIADQAAELGVEPSRVQVIHSGVDTERFQPRDRLAARQRLQLPADVPLVLFVGNLEPRKQVDVLLRAIALVREQLRRVVVLVAGSGESAGVQDQTARLQRLVGELGLERTVRFVGRLDDERLLDAYAAADVFALPSSSEAQGIVALEAMACGLTVVASGVGGLLGTIDDGQNGFLVPSGDVDALSDRLIEALSEANVRRQMGHAARRTVVERFAWQHTVQATVEVYREALA